ncbi:CLUMA_CG006509, isoform A [Clunio marinus]|uniref:CLUMA_CG006509, isoform A n=1 Tax=Clunio marinus TaxID=568069 RepID=A0A1J1HY86_9DIPT|nr:CLUMA_CG006509, isoform A [Clunio marinus]
MGQAESNVTSGVKKQAGVSTQKLYKLVNLKGGGLLVDMMKRAINNKQFAEIDHAIKTKASRGRYIPIANLVKLRNCDRPKHKQLPEIRILENPEEDFDIEIDCPDVSEADYLINPSAYREVVWDIKERGAVGETILHLCLLNATSLHADLAKRLLRFYPKLINDIYMGDEYYGENVLHIAIVNEDPAMVKFLLDSGSNIHERCCGTFMSPEDQKGTRYDIIEQEPVCVNPITNYEGYVYWGEYPLSFAACLGQEECYRLVLAKHADPDYQDINGNTVLHMLVIHEKLTTFDMAYETGASLRIKNALNLTPLTLAAKLARVEMFFHIINIEREIYWQLGSITCAAYPLEQLDTIDTKTGNISKDSTLNLVVFGDKDEHLDLLEGVLIDLLKVKWETFVKAKFYRQFYLFAIYFFISLFAFGLRPKAIGEGYDEDNDKSRNITREISMNDTSNSPPKSLYFHNLTEFLCNYSAYQEVIMQTEISITNTSELYDNSTLPIDDSNDWTSFSECPLMDISTWENRIKLGAEGLLTIGALYYILTALREARFLGAKMFFENLSTAPSRVMFLFSCWLMLTVPFLKFFCLPKLEDHVAVAIMLTTSPYFLFFCRFVIKFSFQYNA